jgi:hypothetical protein
MEAMLLMALEAWARGQHWQVATGQQHQKPAVDAVTSKLTQLTGNGQKGKLGTEQHLVMVHCSMHNNLILACVACC